MFILSRKVHSLKIKKGITSGSWGKGWQDAGGHWGAEQRVLISHFS